MLFKIKLLLEYISDEQVFISKVLELYRYIIRWQTGNKTSTVENKIRNIADEVWQPISEAFKYWKTVHGFGELNDWLEYIANMYGHDYLDQLIDNLINEHDIFLYAEDENGEYDYETVEDIDEHALRNALENLTVMDTRIFNNNKSIEDFIKVLQEEKNSVYLYWSVKREFYIALRRHWEFTINNVYAVVRNINNVVDYYYSGDVNKIIIAIDQAIDLQHVTGSMFEYSGLEINSDELRDEINKLGNFKLPVAV